MITSGQCTIGAVINESSRLPIASVSPSFTVRNLRVDLAEKLPDQRLGLGGADDLHAGVPPHKRANLRGVVRLHMLHDEVIKRPAFSVARRFSKNSSDTAWSDVSSSTVFSSLMR